MKKIALFIAGLVVVPYVPGLFFAYISKSDDYEIYVGFWGITYLLIYLLFPLLYRGKIREKISNKYIFYLMIYATIFMLYSFIYFLF